MATNWQIGDKIPDYNTGRGRWEIYKILRGGMGIVYVVYDDEHRHAYAAKTFQDEVFAKNPEIADRFTQEAVAWVNLDLHRNITQACFVETIASKPFLFLEYVSGGDLSGWIGTARLTDDLPQVLRFAIHFCDGMIHALSKGIKAHRDIKPQNCLITEDGTLKVTDFGLAKVFEDVSTEDVKTEDVQRRSGFLGRLLGRRQAGGTGVVTTPNVQGLSIGLSHTGAAAGTCTHMAPEQFDDAKHVDARADIYSFGVMLFQMITGKLPFAGRTWEEFERLHRAQAPPKLATRNAELDTVIHTCLAKDPGHRFTDFGSVRQHLVEIYERLTGEAAAKPVTGAELDAMHQNNKGVSLSKLARYEEAIACYDRALEFNPRLALARSNKGVALNELRRFSEGIACFNSAIALDDHFAQPWFNKGALFFELKRYGEALACYEKAQQLGHPEAARVIASSKELSRTGLQTPGQRQENIRWLYVCGKANARTPRYEAAEGKVVERVFATRQGRLAEGQRIRTLTGPTVPDQGDVTGFVRILQMREGIGLIAARTEFYVQDGISFLIIEMS